MRRHYLNVVISFLFLTLLTSCGSNVSTDRHTSSVTITVGSSGTDSALSMHKAAAIPSSLNNGKIVFTISGNDMSTITKELLLSGQTEITETFDVQNGDNRSFKVEAVDSSGSVLYIGEKTGVKLDGNPITLDIMMEYVVPAIPSAPTGVSASAGDTQNTVTWSAVTGATSYNIYWSTTTGVTTSNGTKITGATSPYTHIGLTNGTTYYYIVTAVNLGGESIASSQVNATPLPPVPSVPTGVSASAGDTQNTVTWSAVTGATSYNIYWSTTPGVTTANGTKITGATSPYTHTGLTNGTTYYYIVTAANLGGESIASSQVSASPLPPVPSAPTGVSASAGDTQNTVTWSAVTGATSYNIYWSTTAGVTTANGTKITGASSPYNHTGLTNGMTYYYIVTAVSLGGESVASSQVSSTPLLPLPSAPTGVSATAGDTQNTVTWSAVTGATSYNIYWSTTTGVTTSNGTKITGATSPYTHTGLTNGTTYYYIVTAVNLGGESAASSQVLAMPLPAVSIGNPKHVVMFRDVLPWSSESFETIMAGKGYTAGTAVGQYTILASSYLTTVTLSATNDLVWIANDQPTSFYANIAANMAVLDTFLQNGGFIMWGAADSGWAGGFMATAGLALPCGVTHTTNTSSGNNLNANPAHPLMAGIGATITGDGASHESFANYPQDTIVYATDQALPANPTLIEYSCTNGRILLNGQTWEHGYENGYTVGNVYLNVFDYLLGATTPNAPAGVSAAAGNVQTTISWNPVLGATSYNIYWSITAGVTKTTGTKITGATSPYTHSALTNGTPYYYIVTAVNAAGESADSSEVSATPLASPAFPPTGVSASAGDTQNTVTWTAVTGATSYNIYWSTTTGVTTLTGTKITGATSPYTHTGLTNGTTYYYIVTAVNLGGESVASSQVSASPLPSVPSAPTGVSASAGDTQNTVTWSAVTGATSYNIYWSTTTGVTTLNGTKITGASSPYTHTGLTNGTTYYYIVTAVNAGGESIASSQVSASPLPPVPSAPTGVSATAGDTQNTVTWSAVTGATSYNIYWSTTTGVTTSNGTKITGATSPYTHSGLTNGTTYYYIVTAANLGGESIESSQVSASPLPSVPSAPTGVSATAGNAQVSLTWTAVSGATSYKVYRSTTSGTQGTLLGTSTSAAYTDSTAANGVTYYYTITAVNAGGESAGSTQVSGTPQTPTLKPRFAYVANYYSNTISIYTVDSTTGQLRHNGYIAAGSNPYSVTVDPSGKFAYVANYGSNNVSVYTINQTTGALTAGTAMAAGSFPTSVTVDPSGKFAYVANLSSDNVSVYTINQTTGALTAGTAVAAGSGPVSVTVDPSGKFAYVANRTSNNVSVYTIDQTTGALTPGTPVAAGSGPVSVTVDPSGKFAYVANYYSNNVSVYTINQTTGALTAGTAVAAGTYPASVTVDPSGKFAYVANWSSNNVSVYTIDQTTGALTPGTAVAAGTNPTSVTVDPSGKFAYVTNYVSNNVSVYTIDQTTGALTPASTISTQNYPSSIVMVGGSAAVTYVPKFAYVANSASSNVSVYTIDQTTGALTAGTAVAAGTYPYSVTVDPSGKFAYVTNYGSNNVSVYTIDQTTGALTAGTAVAAGTNPISVTVDPSGKFAYVANYGSNNVSVYTIDQTTGALTAGTAVAAGTYPYSVTVDPSGKFAYVTNYGSNNVSVYTIDQTTGALTAGTPVAAGALPVSVTVDPSGKFAYVANWGSNNVSVYTINQTTGALTAGTAVAAGSNPRSVTVDPSGKFAYVANYSSGNVSVYTINQTTGALTAGTAVAAGTYPTSVTVDPSGKFAYVANSTSGNVSVYTIDQTTGALTAGTPVAAGAGPLSVTTTGSIQ